MSSVVTYVPMTQQASTIKPQEIEQLWPNVLYIGKPTLMVGDPGLGKSLVTTDIVARVTTGRAWPLGVANANAGDVLMCSAEDDPSDTIVPRLIAAGADLERVEFWDSVVESSDEGSSVHSVSLDRHLEQLAELARRKAGRLRLVIVDPIAAFLGKTDSHNNGEIRALVGGLARIAAQHRFSVLVVSHLNKGGTSKAVYRIMGSIGFVAAARAAFAVVRDPEDAERRLVLPVKNNLAADTEGLSFCISVADNDAPHVVWGDEAVTQQAADAVLEGAGATPREQAVNARVREVADWMKEQLGKGPVSAQSMWRRSEEAGFSKRDVNRAKSHLGVQAFPMGHQGSWHWGLSAAKP